MASLFCCLRRSQNLSSSSLTRMSRAVVSCSSVVLQQPQAVVAAAELPVSQNHLHQNNNNNNNNNYMKSQICWFRSSPVASAARYNNNNNDDDDKIGPDTILFEGCDYNHWLITMDFPKDPKPTPEEMVETYVQTLAKVVGSVEEAKKRMYACSTTTYQGFQAVMTEEMSEKFKGLPGVVFILPDSYIDPVNKEYGGDKYIDGVIIPRPPPVQYQKGGRFDRNRQQGPAQGDGRNYEARQNYGPGDGNNHGAQRNYPPQRTFSPNPTGQGDGRSFPAQQNYAPQQNYGPSPTGQGGPGNPMTGNRDYVPGGRGPMPSYQRELPQAGRSDYVPQDNRDFRGDNRNFSPSASGDYRQGAGSSYAQNYTGNGVGQRFPQMEQRDGLQGAGSSYDQNYTQNGAGQRFTQMEQRDGLQGAGSSYDQNYTGNGAGQRFPQMEQRDGLQGEQRAFSPMGQTRNNQGGY